MKLTRVLIILLIIVLAAVVWSKIQQSAMAPETVEQTESQTTTNETPADTGIMLEGESEVMMDDSMHATDVGMEMPVPDKIQTTSEANVDLVGPSTGKAWADFELTGKNFAFFQDDVEAPELRVKAGDLVQITFTSTGGFHDFVIDEFDAQTERVNTGDTTTVTFTATKAGVYEYYCSVGQHRANGMVGKFIVQ